MREKGQDYNSILNEELTQGWAWNAGVLTLRTVFLSELRLAEFLGVP